MPGRPYYRLAALAAAVSLEALLLAGPALAQPVQVFEEAPSIEQLRKILIPESRGGASRKIELPRRDTIEGPRMVQPAAAPATDPAPSAVPAPMAPAPAAAPAAAPPPPKASVAAPAVAPPTVPSANAAAAPPETAEAGIVGFRINFTLNSAVIPSTYYAFVDQIGELLRQEPQLSLLIEGHTDALGSDAYNLDLSERRALAVAEYLVRRQGIEPERLSIAGKGKTEPLMDDPYDPRNRRVQFVRVE